MSALRLINETSVSGSVNTLEVPYVFTSDFDIYKVTIKDWETASTTADNCYMRFIDNSGNIITTATIDFAGLGMIATTSFYESRNTNQSAGSIVFGSDNPEGANATMYFFNPMNTNSYTFSMHQSAEIKNNNFTSIKQIQVLKQTGLVSGFSLTNYTKGR
jgi:hypothetical protein